MALPVQVLLTLPESLKETAATQHFEGTYPLESLSAGSDEYRFEEPLSWAVDVTNTGEALLVAGSVEGLATIQCARCLEEASYSLVGDIEGYFIMPGEDGQIDDPDDLEGDEFFVLGEDRVIDLAPLMEAGLRLELPLVPLCRDDCAGLCPHCGANLNEESCTCADNAAAEAMAESPFAALKNLHFDD